MGRISKMLRTNNVMGNVSTTKLSEINHSYIKRNHDRLRLLNNRCKSRRFSLSDNNTEQMVLSQQQRILNGESWDIVGVAKNFHLSTNWKEKGKAVSFPPISALIATCYQVPEINVHSLESPHRLRQDSNYFIALKYTLNVIGKSPIGFDRLTEDQIQQIHRILQHGLNAGGYRYDEPEIEQEITRVSGILHRGDTKFDYLPSSHVPDALRDLTTWHYQECRSLTMFKDILHASQFYLRFLWTSPFTTDNHKVAHIFMSYILDYRGYPAVHFDNFHRYHTAVINAYQGRPELFYDMIVDGLEEGINRDMAMCRLSEFDN